MSNINLYWTYEAGYGGPMPAGLREQHKQQTRAAGESYLAAVRRDYLAELARRDSTAGIASPGFAAMIRHSPP